MAARRGKSQARRNGSSGLPGWAWLVIGILIALLAVLIAPRFLKGGDGDGFLRIGPKPNPDALPASVDEDSDAIAPDIATDAPATDKPKPTQYDFYTLLPGEGVQMTDAELAAIHDALVASIPPEEMMFVARWLVPFMNPAERAGMLGEMRSSAPAPAFAAVLDTVRPHLTATEWSKLAQALQLPG